LTIVVWESVPTSVSGTRRAPRQHRPVVDHGGEELEVDLVDDAGPGRHDAQVAERGLGPAQELVALAVALVLALDVEGERAGVPNRSTWTEWSMTRSAGTSGLTAPGRRRGRPSRRA
jgi:hypothetical protein